MFSMLYLQHQLSTMLVSLVVFFSSQLGIAANSKILHFEEAKKLARPLHEEQPYTIYCHCRYSGKVVDLESCGYKTQSMPKRAARIEWEHVVPAEAFGQSFKEWREGSDACVKHGKRYKGRKCARTNSDFSKMESDLYNLWPEVGELNALRSNFSMAALTESKYDFGGCKAKISDRKFEPMDSAKGIVARTYQYMDQAYPGRGVISEKNQKLFEAWSALYPVTDWECKRAKKIEAIQESSNPILDKYCKK